MGNNRFSLFDTVKQAQLFCVGDEEEKKKKKKKGKRAKNERETIY